MAPAQQGKKFVRAGTGLGAAGRRPKEAAKTAECLIGPRKAPSAMAPTQKGSLLRTTAYYLAEAARFRELAEGMDEETASFLRTLADDYQQEADRDGPEAEPPLSMA